MANLSKDIQCAGYDTRPPMLDRTDFTSWHQRIRLYCRGKENGVNILKSIDEGPFQMGTFKETLAEGEEGALHLGPERARVYSDLSLEDKERYNADIRDNVKMLMEGSELTKEDHESQLYDDFEHFCQNKGETIHDYYVRNQATIQDNRVVVQNVQGRQSRGHIVRKCTQLKRPHNSEYFKDKILLMQAQENKANKCDAFDFDVDEAPTAHTMFMANLSSANLVYDEVGLSYDSDILSEEVQHALYNGLEFIKTHHVPTIVHNSEDTLEIAEITRKKMNDKMKTPMLTEQNINIRPLDYPKENYLATFTPQTQLTPEQIFLSKDVLKIKANALKENDREVHLDYLEHLKESVATLREILEKARVERPLDRSLASSCLYTKHSQELLEYV
nr:hypothetical protein [Tanacetum cinerariifolium]